MTRGEIWWADFGLPFGSEAGFRRPVLVVQDDAFTRSRIRTVVVVPITSNLLLEKAPGNVRLEKEDSGLSKESVVVVSQVGALDKGRLMDRVGKLGRDAVEDVEAGLRLVLGI